MAKRYKNTREYIRAISIRLRKEAIDPLAVFNYDYFDALRNTGASVTRVIELTRSTFYRKQSLHDDKKGAQ